MEIDSRFVALVFIVSRDHSQQMKHFHTFRVFAVPNPTTMPSKSTAQTLLEKADKKANSSTGWFSSSSAKYEEAGDLYQQAANAFKIDKQFRDAGDAFAREAECRERCKEVNDAANAWWNAAKAYKRGYPECRHTRTRTIHSTQPSIFSGYPSFVSDSHPPDSFRSIPSGCGQRKRDRANISA